MKKKNSTHVPTETAVDIVQEEREARRKRGAQPGNQNALKHGFYADQAGTQLLDGLYAASGMEGLDADIEYMRAKILQLEQLQPTNFKLIFEGQRTLSLMVCRKRMAAKGGLEAVGEAIRKAFCGINAAGTLIDAGEVMGVIKE